MKPAIPITAALTDPNLLGAALGSDLRSWRTWIVVLKAAFGEPLSEEDRQVFDEVSGNRAPPGQRVRELWCIVGRRGGKSRQAAAVAVFQAVFVQHHLAAGETGYVLVLAPSRDQASVVLDYVVGFLRASPVLAQEIDEVTTHEVRLRNGIVIATHSNSFRSVRGRTLVCAILDEVAFFRDETSALPDIEAYRAILPSLLTTRGMLVAISTPYRKLGLLHQKHRDYFGVSDNDVLIVTGPSTVFNPQLSEADITQAFADDPEGSTSEWEAQFRSDLSSYLDDPTIDAAVDRGRPLELPPRNLKYTAFVDPSGGRHDAYTICIGHKEGQRDSARFIADVVRGTRAPLDPVEVTKRYAALAQEYGLQGVVGDSYSGEWVVSAFRDAGIKYTRAEQPKSQLYLEALPFFMRQAISLPDHPQLLRELRLLERQTHRSGRDTIDHGRRGSDDHANATLGCAAFVMRRRGYDIDAYANMWRHVPDREWQARMYYSRLLPPGHWVMKGSGPRCACGLNSRSWPAGGSVGAVL
jgi:Terminase large subunit, ATPase domain